MNLLDKIQTEQVHKFPFAHAVIEKFLPDDICEKLIDNYPDLAAINPRAKENSFRFLYNMKQVQKDSRISDDWKEVLAYLSSPESFYQIAGLFSDELMKRYPKTFKSKEQIKKLRIGIRGIDSYLTKDVLLDAQVRGNTGDEGPSCVQPPHIDSDFKIYSGLLYLRPDGDDTQGGDLEVRELIPNSLYELNEQQKAEKFYSDGPYINPDFTQINKKVPYSKNTLFLFMNSLDSIHSVSERAPTPNTRKFIGFTAEMRKPLFMAQPTIKNKLRFYQKEFLFYFALLKLKAREKLASIAFLKKVYRQLKN